MAVSTHNAMLIIIISYNTVLFPNIFLKINHFLVAVTSSNHKCDRFGVSSGKMSELVLLVSRPKLK